jgi:hypothetical protein
MTTRRWLVLGACAALAALVVVVVLVVVVSQEPKVHLGDIPAWFAWIATVGVLVVALVQIGTERRRRHEAEEHERNERHLAQARLVSAILGPEERPPPGVVGRGTTAVELVNGSDEPVYMLVVGIVEIQGAAPHTIEEWLELRQDGPYQPIPVTTVSILPRGTFRVSVDGVGWSSIAMQGRSGVDVAFTDRAGSHWIRRATGKLEELHQDPLEYFLRWGLSGPYDLQTPRRVD